MPLLINENKDRRIIEIYYMISLMEEYATKPIPLENGNRKRGKDFMYNLIKDVDINCLDSYKKTLILQNPLNKPLEDLLPEYIKLYQPFGFIPIKNLPQITPSKFDDQNLTKPYEPSSLALPKPKTFVQKTGLSNEEKESFVSLIFGKSKSEENNVRKRACESAFTPYAEVQRKKYEIPFIDNIEP